MFTIPPEIDRRSVRDWYEIGNGQAIVASSDRGKRGGQADNVTSETSSTGSRTTERSRNRSSSRCKPDRRDRASRRRPSCLLSVLPAPAILLAIEPLIVMVPSRSVGLSGGGRGHAQERHGLSLVAVLALSSVLAVIAWRRCRGFGLSRARAGRLGGVRAAPRSSRPMSGFLLFRSLAGPGALSELPCARLPAIVPPARSVEHASRTLPQGNRDLRLKRSWARSLMSGGQASSELKPLREKTMVLAIVRKELRETRAFAALALGSISST